MIRAGERIRKQMATIRGSNVPSRAQNRRELAEFQAVALDSQRFIVRFSPSRRVARRRRWNSSVARLANFLENR